ncbi:MAG: hypothetical protein ACWGO1_14940 [Anaerolineales bacterium]
MVNSTIDRRLLGVLLGSSMGLVYGIVSQSINKIMLPGIMLHQPPFGMAGNILLWLLVGAILGFVSAIPEETLSGVILGATVGAVFVTIISLLTGRTDAGVWAGKFISVLILFVPIAALLVPVTGVFRWAINKVIEARIDSDSTWRTVRRPLLLVVLVAAIGTFALLPPHARIMLARTDAMLEKGLQSTSTDQLPEALQHERVGGFMQHASLEYTLQWQNKNINRFAIPRPLTDRPWEESAIIAHFDSGWRLVCIYADSEAQPACRGFVSW